MKRMIFICSITSAVIIGSASEAAEKGDCLTSDACLALTRGIGSKPGPPTEDLVCFEYRPVPIGTHVSLDLHTIDAAGEHRSLWPVPRVKIATAADIPRRRFCVGMSWYKKADEAFMCAKFPDGTEWHAARRRKQFDGTGAFERAFSMRRLRMCLGPWCPPKFTD